MHVVSFERKHLNLFCEHNDLWLNAIVRGAVGLRFEDSPSGLKLTLSDMAQHLGHEVGTRRTKVLP